MPTQQPQRLAAAPRLIALSLLLALPTLNALRARAATPPAPSPTQDATKGAPPGGQELRRDRGVARDVEAAGVGGDASGGWRGRPLAELEREAARGAGDAAARYNLGAALYSAGRYEEASAELSEAARLDAKFAAPRRTLGLALFKLKRYGEAAAAFEELTRLEPELAEAHNNLGVARGKAGKYDAASAAFETAIRLRPDYAEARFNLGAALLVVKRRERALEQLTALQALDPALADKLFRLIHKDKLLDVGRK